MKTQVSNSWLHIALALMAAVILFQTGGAASADDNSSAALFKDLDIRQKPMVNIEPPAPEGRRDNGSLAVSATLDRPDRRYRHGDDVVLTIQTSEDAYVWVLDTGTSGKVHQIFPNQYDTDNYVTAGMPLSIPGEDSEYMLAVSHPKGKELITVIASRENAPLTDALIDRATSTSPFPALRGTAKSVAKDLSISLRQKQSPWAMDQQVLIIE